VLLLLFGWLGIEIRVGGELAVERVDRVLVHASITYLSAAADAETDSTPSQRGEYADIGRMDKVRS
jgi:hypothetical protein